MLVVLLVLGVLVALGLGWVGSRLLLAGRQLDRVGGETRIPVAPDGSVAAKVDARLQRTRARVETLVMPEYDEGELEPSPGAYRDRAQTYSVFGLGLVGLAAVLAIGVLLVL